MRLVLACGASLAIGFLGGQLSAAGPRPRAAAAPPAPTAETRPATPPVLVRSALAPDDVERIGREVATAVAGSERCTAPAPVAEPDPPPEPDGLERQIAGERLRALLDAALAAGMWTDDDAAELRALLGHVSPQARDDALTTLAAALNAQALRIATQGAPL